jgi:hypothetical protein
VSMAMMAPKRERCAWCNRRVMTRYVLVVGSEEEPTAGFVFCDECGPRASKFVPALLGELLGSPAEAASVAELNAYFTEQDQGRLRE